MAVGDVHVFPGFLIPVLTQLFFPKPPTTFLTCFCRGDRRKYAGKKVRLNWGSNSLPPGHEPNTRQVRERHDVNNIRDYERALQGKWVRIPLQVIRKLICSMRRRCLAVLAANGGHTRY